MYSLLLNNHLRYSLKSAVHLLTLLHCLLKCVSKLIKSQSLNHCYPSARLPQTHTVYWDSQHAVWVYREEYCTGRSKWMKCYAHLSSLALAPPPPDSSECELLGLQRKQTSRKEEYLFFSPHSIHRACENSPLLGPPDRDPVCFLPLWHGLFLLKTKSRYTFFWPWPNLTQRWHLDFGILAPNSNVSQLGLFCK